MLLEGERLEPLSRNCSVIVSRSHYFTTDTLLLASFSLPKSGEICADFGTGCGAIPLVWCARGKPGRIYALELQEEACSQAARSAELNRLQEVISVHHLNLRGLSAERPGFLRGLDLVACNPPYKAAGSGARNSGDAKRIARHECECTLPEIAAAAAAVLRFGGRFCLCQRPERLCDVLEAMRRNGLEPKRIRFVHQRVGKEPSLFLVQGTRGGKPGLRVEPPLFIEDGDGYSREMLEIYGDYREGVT